MDQETDQPAQQSPPFHHNMQRSIFLATRKLPRELRQKILKYTFEDAIDDDFAHNTRFAPVKGWAESTDRIRDNCILEWGKQLVRDAYDLLEDREWRSDIAYVAESSVEQLYEEFLDWKKEVYVPARRVEIHLEKGRHYLCSMNGLHWSVSTAKQ